MAMKSSFKLSVAIAAAMGCWPVSAHHSFALFDNSKVVELAGTVLDFQWTNPHCWVQLTVQNGAKNVEYSIEGQSPNSLVRQGWSRNALKIGDKVKIKIHPRKDGSNGGSFVSAIFPDGRVLESPTQ